MVIIYKEILGQMDGASPPQEMSKLCLSPTDSFPAVSFNKVSDWSVTVGTSFCPPCGEVFYSGFLGGHNAGDIRYCSDIIGQEHLHLILKYSLILYELLLSIVFRWLLQFFTLIGLLY